MESEAWAAYQRARTQMLRPPPEGERIIVGPSHLDVSNLLAAGPRRGQRYVSAQLAPGPAPNVLDWGTAVAQALGAPEASKVIPAQERVKQGMPLALQYKLEANVSELSIYDPITRSTSVGTRAVGKIVYRFNVTVYEYRGLWVLAKVAVWRLQARGEPLNWDKLMKQLPKVCEKTFVAQQAFTIEDGRLRLDNLYFED